MSPRGSRSTTTVYQPQCIPEAVCYSIPCAAGYNCNPQTLRLVAPGGQEALLPVEESNKTVREQISRQEFSAEDVERHLEERRRIRDAMVVATEAKEKARKV